MKLHSISIDGFGLFSDEEIGPFRDGLNIVVGANEVGKSTLLDFVRGVLYGFANGTSKRRQRLPLKGGRHGGRLTLIDAQEQRWVIERHGRELSVRSDSHDGLEGPLLSSLVGHTDKSVFESIFAFGLSELERLETLDEGEIRDAIFSAGIRGAGRTATGAIKQFDEERLAITRSNRGETNKSLLQRRLDEKAEISAELERARLRSSLYPTMRAAVDRQRELITSSKEQLQTLECRRDELGDLLLAKSLVEKRGDIDDELRTLGPSTEAEKTLLSVRSDTEELNARFAGHESNRHECSVRSIEIEALERKIDAFTKEIGADRPLADMAPVTIALEADVEATADQHRALTLESEVLSRSLHEHESELARLQEEVILASRSVGEQGGSPTRSLDDLSTLRSLASELASLDNGMALERERRVAIAGRSRESERLPTFAFAAVVVLGIAMSLTTLLQRGHHLAIFPLSLALFVTLLSLVAFLRELRRNAVQVPPVMPRSSDYHLDLCARVRESARAFGLASRPSVSEIDAKERKLRVEEAELLRLSLLHERESAAKRGVEDLRRSIADNLDKLCSLERGVWRLTEEIGLRRPCPASSLPRVVESIKSAQHLLEEQGKSSLRRHDYEQRVESYELEITRLFSRCGLPVPHRDAIEANLHRLLADCSSAAALAEKRSALRQAHERLTENARTCLSRYGRRQELLVELEDRSREDISEEQQSIALSIETERNSLTEYLKRLTELERDLLTEESSTTIASLELELDCLNEDISELARSWATLATTSVLLKRTLRRYETERQPAVIARAGQLFSQATEGRYTKLVTHEDASARRTIEVLRPDGTSIASEFLSTGTAQLLYLCVRLAYAENFAKEATPLPLVFDDVLVNLDPHRCELVAHVLANVAQSQQIVLFTCHPHMLKAFRLVDHELNVIDLSEQKT